MDTSVLIMLSGGVEFITLENNDHNSLFPVDGVYDRMFIQIRHNST